MRIIKLSAIDSTNTFLRQVSSADSLEDYTTVVAEEQLNGRGQMGTVWASEKGKNLTFSVFKEVSFLKFKDQFYLSMVTSLALLKTLRQFNIPKVSIKWPNDILAEGNKVCGVLIENVIQQNSIQSSVIGVGLNVNQTKFNNLVKASSMLLLSGKPFNLDEILNEFLKQLKHYMSILEENNRQFIKQEYEANLFRKNKPSTFKNAEGNMFSGFIKGVSKSGNLIVLLEDEELKEFNLKEISLLY